MSNDYFRIFRVKTKEFDCFFRYETMRSSVETIFTYFIFIIVFFRNCIHICFFRHCLMECSIKYSYVWFTWHQFHTCTDTHQVCRVMQRTKVTALFDNRDYFIVDNTGIRDFSSTMQYTMSDCFYFVKAL